MATDSGSSIKIVNNTGENIRVAIFKQNYKTPSLGVMPWKVVNPPNTGGSISVPVPQEYEVFINYPNGSDPTDPNAGYQSPQIKINTPTASFLVTSEKTMDNQATTLRLSQTFNNLNPNEIDISNQAGSGVWGHVTKDGKDIYPPEIIWPGGVLMQDVRPELYVALVAYYVVEGTTTKQEELSASTAQIAPGQVATVTGTSWTGFSIAVTNAN